MKLTKISKDKLFKQFNGTGVIFIKTGCREMIKIEFYLSKNNKFYVINNIFPSTELTQALYGIIPEIEPEEIESEVKEVNQ